MIAGQPWMDWRCICNWWDMQISRNGFTMDEHTTTTLRLFFAFAPMVQFWLPSSTYLDLYMTVRLLSTAIFTIRWREYFCQLGQSAALTLHLAMCQENSSISRVRIIWVLRHPHVNWENLVFKKKRGNVSSSDSRVGNAHDTNVVPSLKDRFVYEERGRGEQRIYLKMLVLIYNMCARMVGINQIRNTYMKYPMRDADEDIVFWLLFDYCFTTDIPLN